MLYYFLTSAILAALLFYPAWRLIWVLSVRRIERKTKRKLSEQEIAGQRRRAAFLAFFLVLIFSFVFNYNLLGPQDG